MQYQVLVRKPADTHFVASVVGLSDVIANGKTEEEAISNVKAELASQLKSAKLVTIEMEPEHSASLNTSSGNGMVDEAGNSTFGRNEDSPWKRRAGAFADDPTWDDFLEEMAAYRRQVDRETNL